jgi:hypothetical protein
MTTTEPSDELHVAADVTFAILPTWLLDSSVSASAIRAYALLASYADNVTKRARPSRATLARRMGCSRDTIDRALRELVDVGALSRRKRWTDDGAPTSSEYVVHVVRRSELSTGVAADVRLRTRTDAAGVAAPVRHRTRTNELEDPLTPALRAEGAEHRGQHKRCRACGTSPRAVAAAQRAAAAVKPPWCGECDEQTRLVDVDATTVARCSTCHPTRERITQ